MEVDGNNIENIVIAGEPKKNKKRRRDKHRARYSPEPLSSQNTGKHHSRKRKRKSSDLPGEQEPPRQGIKLFVSIRLKKRIFVTL